MIPEVSVRGRRELLWGAALGVYATMLAMAPGVALKAILAAPLVAIPILWALIRTPTAWLALFFGCALLTPPLPIALGDSGPHIAIVIAGFGLFAGFLRLSEWRFQPDALSISLLALVTIFASSIAIAAIYSGGAIAAASFARVALFGISIYIFLYARDGPGRLNPAQSRRAIRWLFWAGAFSALFACIDFYFQFHASRRL